MKQRLTFLAPINTFTGYGLLACQIVRDLERIAHAYISIRAKDKSEAFGATIPVDILSRVVQNSQVEPWELFLTPPDFHPTPGKKCAYFTMWESTRLPPYAPRILNAADVVIVPCQWCASTFSACGIDTPIRVVPLGINTDIYRFQPMARNAGGEASTYPEVVFGCAGRLQHGGVRKGINEVMQAFVKAFPTEKNVKLRVKAFPDCPLITIDDPRIEVIRACLPEHELAEWYASLTCFVSAARGEGFGLMQCASMAVGRPVISVNYGGVSEYINEENSFVIPHILVPAEHTYKGCGHWALPNEEAMISTMRYIYNNPEEAERRGALASQAASKFTYERSVKALYEVLKEFGALK